MSTKRNKAEDPEKGRVTYIFVSCAANNTIFMHGVNVC